MNFLPSRGFTLAETLMVVALVAILATVSMQGLVSGRERGRDTARMADLERIALGVRMYYEACKQFPATLALNANNGCPSGTTLGTYIASLPVAPTGSAYGYSTSGAGNSHNAFVLRAVLETSHAVLADDIDGSSYKGVTMSCDDAPAYNYCIGS